MYFPQKMFSSWFYNSDKVEVLAEDKYVKPETVLPDRQDSQSCLGWSRMVFLLENERSAGAWRGGQSVKSIHRRLCQGWVLSTLSKILTSPEIQTEKQK